MNAYENYLTEHGRDAKTKFMATMKIKGAVKPKPHKPAPSPRPNRTKGVGKGGF